MTPRTGIEEVDAVLAAEWPRMQLERLGVLALCAGVIAVGGWAGIATLQGPEPGLGAAIAVGALFGAYWIARALRRSHERRLMPVLARAAGLEFDPDPGRQVAALPVALLPKGAEKSEDMLSGRFGDRHLNAVELQIETGGKNSTTLFDGFVVTVSNLLPQPEFTLVLDNQTRAGFLTRARHDVTALSRFDSYGRWGRSYGIWGAHSARTDARVHAFLDRVFAAEGAMGSSAEIHAVVRTAQNTFVAVKHPRDLFRLGGLFAGREALTSQIEQAFNDLKLPLKAAEKVIEAEEALASAAPAA